MDILLYALIAAFIAHRLYLVLGHRNADEPSPRQQSLDAPKPRREGDVLPLSLPRLGRPKDNEASPLSPEPAPNSLAGGLWSIRAQDAAFDEKQFLRTAKLNFEMIVTAFVTGDRAGLQKLLPQALYDSFAAALDAREQAGEKHELKLLSVREADIVAARCLNNPGETIGEITVQFISDQARLIRFASDDKIIKDPGRAIERLTDRWTFRRRFATLPSTPANSSTPAAVQPADWQLVQTASF